MNIVNYCQRKHFEIFCSYIVYVPVDYTKIVNRDNFIFVQIFEWQLEISVWGSYVMWQIMSFDSLA